VSATIYKMILDFIETTGVTVDLATHDLDVVLQRIELIREEYPNLDSIEKSTQNIIEQLISVKKDIDELHQKAKEER
jgi:hypothetical protein